GPLGHRDALPGQDAERSVLPRLRSRGRGDCVPPGDPRLGARAPQLTYRPPRQPSVEMKLQHDISIVRTTHPFVIARGGASEHRLIRVRVIDDDGTEGWGEASPNRFYGETVD